MTSKQSRSREERRAAIAKEIAELNGEIERLKISLEASPEPNELHESGSPNDALRLALAPPRVTPN